MSLTVELNTISTLIYIAKLHTILFYPIFFPNPQLPIAFSSGGSTIHSKNSCCFYMGFHALLSWRREESNMFSKTKKSKDWLKFLSNRIYFSFDIKL